MILSTAQPQMVTSPAKATGHATLPWDICPIKEKIGWKWRCQKKLLRAAIGLQEKKKHFIKSQGTIISHYLHSSPPGNWALLDKAGGDGEVEEQEAVFFSKGTYTVNNSCNGSLVHWKHYNLWVSFPKSGFNGKQVSPFLKEYSTISLLSLESAVGAPGMKGTLGMKADIYNYCLKGTEMNTM